MKNIIVLACIFVVFFYLHKSCTQGYDRYVYFVQVKNDAVFSKALSDSDSRIVDHGRTLKENVIRMDHEVDKNDGPEKGRVRWYECGGIDCDEGWEQSFMSQTSSL